MTEAEKIYWGMRKQCEEAFDRYFCGGQTEENLLAYKEALGAYQDLCMDMLEDLMDNNPDVLKNLKEW